MKHKVSWKKNRKFRIREKDVMNSLKVITAAGGQNSVTQMIGSLYDAIEDHYGIFASRLYRAFRPKPLKSTATSSWRKMCCLPYAYIYMVSTYVRSLGFDRSVKTISIAG